MAEGKSHWQDRLKRAAPGTVFLIGLGQSVSGVESPVIGFVLMSAAVVWAVGSMVAPPLATRGLDAFAGQMRGRLAPPEADSVGDERERGIRIAKARLTQELEYIQERITTGTWSYWSRHRLPSEEWDEWGDLLAAEGFHQAHKALREVYRLTDALHHAVTERQASLFGGMAPEVSKWDTAKKLCAAISVAQSHLNEIHA